MEYVFIIPEQQYISGRVSSVVDFEQSPLAIRSSPLPQFLSLAHLQFVVRSHCSSPLHEDILVENGGVYGILCGQ